MFKYTTSILVSNKCALSSIPKRSFGITPFFRNAAAQPAPLKTNEEKKQDSSPKTPRKSYISPILNVILFGSLTYIGYDYYNLLNIVNSKDLRLVAYKNEVKKLNSRIDQLIKDEIKFNKDQHNTLKKIIGGDNSEDDNKNNKDDSDSNNGSKISKPSIPKLPNTPIKKSKGWYQFW
ncbi:uncharacterized protein ASCRUDRAFT_76110 [Ascoidea rubescens DSM 1968]|uniref:Uncharacterized protein n=1 Tax=Ascoidea rubescens DSM 1968 TaxID=1344418 RepID=A0A1D2VGY2_9ASCO|nr:hypothetical protein ASCRUDRAFT_76110 [Ascoidea rubescens DSM 1968]ODV60737.1 hypothetical protein ASCRUDRAFT_76110 [Ascoidea rubescens DSM 1968]